MSERNTFIIHLHLCLPIIPTFLTRSRFNNSIAKLSSALNINIIPHNNDHSNCFPIHICSYLYRPCHTVSIPCWIYNFQRHKFAIAIQFAPWGVPSDHILFHVHILWARTLSHVTLQGRIQKYNGPCQSSLKKPFVMIMKVVFGTAIFT